MHLAHPLAKSGLSQAHPVGKINAFEPLDPGYKIFLMLDIAIPRVEIKKIVSTELFCDFAIYLPRSSEES